MHVSSHIRPFTAEVAAPPRQPESRSAAAEFTGLARIAGYPDENRRSASRRRFGSEFGGPDLPDEPAFDEEAARLAEAAQALTVTLTTLELATTLGRAPVPRSAPALPQAAELPGQTPSLDDLLAQALAAPAAQD